MRIFAAFQRRGRQRQRIVVFDSRAMMPSDRTGPRSRTRLNVIRVIVVFIRHLIAGTTWFIRCERGIIVGRNSFTRFTRRVILVLAEKSIRWRAGVFHYNFTGRARFGRHHIKVVQMIVFHHANSNVNGIISTLRRFGVKFVRRYCWSVTI